MKIGRSIRMLELNAPNENRKESEEKGHCERVVSLRDLMDIHDHLPAGPPR